MSASLRILLTHIVDYAGLFPPASLPLEQAIRNYARFRTGADGWMLDRFVCPASRLNELAALGELWGRPAIGLCVVGRGGNTADEWLESLRADCDAITDYGSRPGPGVSAFALEVRLPAVVIGSGTRGVRSLLESDNVGTLRCHGAAIWCELGHAAPWREIAGMAASFNRPDRDSFVGLKVRSGGQDAAAVPSVEQLAFAITACRDAGVRLKFTAGLHHPIRHFDPGLQTKMHGFLNVFAAGVLAHARKLKEAEVRSILAEEDAGAFGFDETGMYWKEHRASVQEIQTARGILVTSFGSCSFDEPREDLRSLGLMA